MQKEDQNKIYSDVKGFIPSVVLKRKNKNRSWLYGYDEKYKLVIISRTGQIDQVVEINGLYIALPAADKEINKRSASKVDQYWERKPIPKELSRINSIFQWNDMPSLFKDKWVDYIEEEFDRRELGYWFYNKGIPTYTTGS